MKKLLTAIFAISVTVPAFALTVTGTILDGDTQEPLYTATVQQVDNPQNGAMANESGAFSITVPDANTKLTFKYLGMKTKNLTAAQANGNTITMETDTEMLEDIVITSCTKNSVANAKSILYNKATKTCVPTECESARYKLTGQTTATKINNDSCTTDPDDMCENGDTSCTTITIGDACVDQVGTDCTAQAGDNVKTAKYEWDGSKLNCVIKKCNDYFMLENGACVASDGPCSDAQIAEIEHAKSGELKNGKCHVTECDAGYEASNNTCVTVGGDCNSLPDDAISGTRKWDAEQNKEICIVTACRDGYSVSTDKLSCKTKLSKEDSQARVDELRDNAKKMRDKEQSTANKLIGAAGIGATGIGTSQALSALAEQRADQNAEDDMRAYLATFKCDYGMGKNINGGDMGIELPGGNELTQYVAQYKTLAADLKVRKDALGISPGIESETIIDAADTGLYDNAATGKTDGAFTSLSRALSDETSADAAEWAKQKADTAAKLKTGATVAAVGAVGSAIANLAVNSGDAKKNKSDEIMKKYDALAKLERTVAALPDAPRPSCPTGASGEHPECTCPSGQTYNQDANTCDVDSANEPQNNDPVEGDSTVVDIVQNSLAETPTPDNQNKLKITLPAVKLFDIGKSVVRDDAKSELSAFGNKMNEISGTACILSITGYTDPIGQKNRNKKLSTGRADAIKNAIHITNTQVITVKTDGQGSANCTCGTGDTNWTFPSDKANDKDYNQCKSGQYNTSITRGRYAPCRRVEITLSCGENTATSGGTLELIKQLSSTTTETTPATSDGNDATSTISTAATNVAAVAVTDSSDLKTKIASQERPMWTSNIFPV